MQVRGDAVPMDKSWELMPVFGFLANPPMDSQCDRCRIAKFIPNLVAARQWMQCVIDCVLNSTEVSASKSKRDKNSAF